MNLFYSALIIAAIFTILGAAYHFIFLKALNLEQRIGSTWAQIPLLMIAIISIGGGIYLGNILQYRYGGFAKIDDGLFYLDEQDRLMCLVAGKVATSTMVGNHRMSGTTREKIDYYGRLRFYDVLKDDFLPKQIIPDQDRHNIKILAKPGNVAWLLAGHHDLTAIDLTKKKVVFDMNDWRKQSPQLIADLPAQIKWAVYSATMQKIILAESMIAGKGFYYEPHSGQSGRLGTLPKNEYGRSTLADCRVHPTQEAAMRVMFRWVDTIKQLRKEHEIVWIPAVALTDDEVVLLVGCKGVLDNKYAVIRLDGNRRELVSKEWL